MMIKPSQVILYALLVWFLSAAKAQLFLQLSGAEDLPSIPLPLDNERRPVQICTDKHPITIRCDATDQGSTRATFFVNGARYHMEFFKPYYIARNRDKIRRPWVHPNGFTTVECRLNNKVRFKTYIMFKCTSTFDISADSSLEPSSDENLSEIPISNGNKPKGLVASSASYPVESSVPSVTATISASSSSSDTPKSEQPSVGPTLLPQNCHPRRLHRQFRPLRLLFGYRRHRLVPLVRSFFRARKHFTGAYQNASTNSLNENKDIKFSRAVNMLLDNVHSPGIIFFLKI